MRELPVREKAEQAAQKNVQAAREVFVWLDELTVSQ
jgi:hypothetical protein